MFPILGMAIVLYVVAPSSAAAFAAQTKAAGKALTVRQLGDLIRKRSPDSAVSQELLSRGLTTPVDWPLIERLKTVGAGPETVIALKHLLPKVRLTIQTAPGAGVALDGQPVDTVGDTGEIVLGVEPGSYELTLAMKNHTTVSRPIRLVLNQPQVVQAPLEWAVGFLTLDAGMPDAQIDIAGVGQYRTRVEKLALPVGPRQIRVTAPFRLGFSTVAVIEGGKTLEVPVKLEIDHAALKAIGKDVLEAYAKSDQLLVSVTGQRYLERGGADPDVLKLLALSYYQAQRFDTFLDIAARALAAGAEMTFHTTHYHSAFTLRGEHAAELGVSTTAIHFAPIGKCNLGEVTVPIAQVQSSIRSVGDSATLTLTVPNPKNPAKTAEINLVDTAPARLEAIMRLIELSRGKASAP